MQATDITVYDGASTPVAHTLVHVGTTVVNKEAVAMYREQLSSLPVSAQVSLRLAVRLLDSGVYRVTSRVEVPVMESINGENAAGYTAAPKVAYVDTFETVAYAHPRSTIEGRRTVRQLCTNLLGNVSTSVATPTAGTLAGLFDLLAVPT